MTQLERWLTTDFVRLAIPFFLMGILWEIYFTSKKSRHQYRLDDAITCLSMGILSELTGVYSIFLTSAAYAAIYRHWGLIEMRSFSTQGQILCWTILVFGIDLAYYWFHRVAHRMNLGWAGHIGHHSSEEYNLAVALRQSSLQSFFSFVFYLPLAWLGFPPEWAASVFSLNLVYQFWIHTREIDRLPGWIEAVFNTPSHHRVHHAINEQYIDKNYAGMFIIWDKVFGTFVLEKENPRFGITTPVRSTNPFWLNFHYFWFLFLNSVRAPSLREGIKLWLAPPDWNPEWLRRLKQMGTVEKIPRQRRVRNKFATLGLLGQFLITLGGALFWLLNYPSLNQAYALGILVLLMGSLYHTGQRLESLKQLGG